MTTAKTAKQTPPPVTTPLVAAEPAAEPEHALRPAGDLLRQTLVDDFLSDWRATLVSLQWAATAYRAALVAADVAAGNGAVAELFAAAAALYDLERARETFFPDLTVPVLHSDLDTLRARSVALWRELVDTAGPDPDLLSWTFLRWLAGREDSLPATPPTRR